MTKDLGYALLRDAINQAKSDIDSDLDYKEKLGNPGGIPTKQLVVTYKTGNEYFRLDSLYQALQNCGAVRALEFNGRGGDLTTSPIFSQK